MIANEIEVTISDNQVMLVQQLGVDDPQAIYLTADQAEQVCQWIRQCANQIICDKKDAVA